MQLISATNGWVLTDKHFLLTADAGQHWQDSKLPKNVSTSVIEGVFFLDTLQGWLVTSQRQTNNINQVSLTISHTIDGGQTWTDNPLAPSNTEYDFSSDNLSISFVDSQHGWVMVPLMSSSNLSRSVLFQTADSGVSWNKLSAPIGAPIRFTTPSDGWIAGGVAGDKFYTTHDGGQTWEPQSVPLPTADNVDQLTYDLPTFQNNQDGVLPVTFAGSKHSGIGFYMTHDGGYSWSLATTVANSTELDPGVKLPAKVIDSNQWVVTLPKDKLHMTKDGGKRWKTTQSNLPIGIIELDFVTSSIGWARTTVGTCAQFKAQCTNQTAVLITTDGGETWTPLLSLNAPA